MLGMKRMRSKGRVVTALMVSALIAACFVLAGCGSCDLFSASGRSVKSIAFNDERLSMEIGQTKEITSSMVTVSPKYASDKSFYIVSDDDNVVSVSGDRTLYGVGYGSATVTVVSNANERVTGKVTVDVAYSSKVTATLNVEGCTMTDSGVVIASAEQSAPVELSIALSAGADPAIGGVWSVNGASAGHTGLTYIYDTPQKAGIYTVTCDLDNGLSESVDVHVYDAFLTTPEGEYAGIIEQLDTYSNVTFTANASLPADNPQPVCDWYVNGAYKASGIYVFKPQQAGEYVVTLKVNGVFATIGGSESVVIRACGTITPTGLTIEFDNCYPNVIVKWDDPGVRLDYEVTVGGRRFRSTNNTVRELFDGTTFNASSVIDIFSGADVSVRSLGNGDLFLESQTAVRATLEAVPGAAKTYLNKRFYDGARNYYMVDEAEFNEAYAAMLLFRRGTDTVSLDAFVAFEAGQTAMELARNASSMSQFTGMYYISAENKLVAKNSVVSVSVQCTTVNEPTVYTGEGGLNKRSAAFNALRPHVNYDRLKERPSNYKFAIDYIDQAVAVRTSEELYFVAEKGFRPVPDAGSRAESIYRTARAALRSIVTDDMTDVEKAHAIYDYVMWKVVYDNEVLGIESTEESVKYAAYYLEGVFDSQAAPFAVCDGIAKAYSLLCNIEGMPCLRVAGMAYTGGSWGGHAWNKVLVDGAWYNVDCTWGDYSMGFRNGSSVVYREMATHEYFLKTDAEFKADHREDTPNDFPPSTDVVYNYYNQKVPFNGGNVDFYIMTAGTALENEIDTLIEYVLSIKPATNSFTVANTVTVSNDFGVEIRIADTVAAVASPKIQTLVDERLKNVGQYIATSDYGGIIWLKL